MDLLICEKRCFVLTNVEAFVYYLLKVRKYIYRISTDTDSTTVDTFTCCSKCKSAVKDTDAVIDAVRIGQEALNKAEALQISSEIL